MFCLVFVTGWCCVVAVCLALGLLLFELFWVGLELTFGYCGYWFVVLVRVALGLGVCCCTLCFVGLLCCCLLLFNLVLLVVFWLVCLWVV